MAARHLQDMGVFSTEYLSAVAFFRDFCRVLSSSHSLPILRSDLSHRVLSHSVSEPSVFAGQKSFRPVGFAEEMRKVRRSHTKSRKGCVQCKNGHVKVG